jgi:hypothetical protein
MVSLAFLIEGLINFMIFSFFGIGGAADDGLLFSPVTE